MGNFGATPWPHVPLPATKTLVFIISRSSVIKITIQSFWPPTVEILNVRGRTIGKVTAHSEGIS